MLMKQDSSGVHYQINYFQCQKVDVKVENIKQRITVLLIVNALGDKEPPIIIGRSLKPRCFNNVKDKRRPCGSYYYANKNPG